MLRSVVVAVLVSGAWIAPAGALAQPAPARPATPVQGPQRPRAVQVMSLETSAWADGGTMPAKHTQAGRDVSPALRWSAVPEGTVSFVLVARDLDEIVPATGEERLHWLVWNIPGSATSLPEGMPQGNPPPQPTGGFGGAPPPTPNGPRQISQTGPNYRGPGAPASGPAHHYAFELYALDSWVDVPAVGQSPAATLAAVRAAMAGHVRGKGVLVGLSRRPSP